MTSELKACVVALVGVAGMAGGAAGQIEVVMDERRAYVTSQGQSAIGTDHYSREGIAAHEVTEPFSAWSFVDSAVTNGAGTALASAGMDMQSEIRPTGFVGSAVCEFTCEIVQSQQGDQGYYASGQADATFAVVFAVDRISEWGLEAMLGLTGLGFASVSVRRGAEPFGPALLLVYGVDMEEVSETLILSPGVYRFETYAGAFGAAFFTDYLEGTAAFDVAFEATGGCPVELTGDGVLDSGDLSAFVTAFIGSDASVDLTGDGVVDSGDLAVFVEFFVAGCP